MTKYGFRLLNKEPTFIFKTPFGTEVRISAVKPDNYPRKNFICIGEVTEFVANIPIFGVCGISYVQRDGKICSNNTPRDYADLILEYETFGTSLDLEYYKLLVEKLTEYSQFKKGYLECIDLTTECIDLTKD